MKEVEHERRIWGGDFRIRLGHGEWDNADPAVGWAWKDKNGEFSRGSSVEIPAEAFAQLVVFAFAHGYLDPAKIAAATAALVDSSE